MHLANVRGLVRAAVAAAVPSIAAIATTASLAVFGLVGCSTDGGDTASGAAPADDVGAGASSDDVGAGAGPGAGASAGAAGGSSDGAAADPAAGPIVPVDLAALHVIGRVDTRDPAGSRFGWPGTELRARFSGPGLALVFADTGTSHYDVSIDGAAPVLLVVTGDAKTYAVAAGLAPGLHDLVLTKRTETITGVTQLLGVVGTLVPTPAPSGRRMELIGDSITCGFGVLGADETCPFSASTQSEPLAWGGLAAKQLGAMHTVVAFSGLGVTRNYGGDTTETMPDRYDRALANDPSSVWDHQGFVPDVIVVSLGTNDFSGGKGDPGGSFEEAYEGFLAGLRAKHPGARIVATTSPMLSNTNREKLHDYIANAVAARAAAGDTKLTMLDIAEQDEADGYGCSWHPSLKTQKKMAVRVAAHVKVVAGW